MKLPNGNPNAGKRKYILLKLADFSKRHIAVFAVVFGAIGGIFLLNNSSAVLEAPSIYLTPDTKQLEAGESFSVQLRANSGETGVNAAGGSFTYPTDKLEFVSIDGTGSGFAIEAPSAEANGTVTVGRGNITAVKGDLLIATVNFKVKAGAEGTGALAFVTTGTELWDATTNLNLIDTLDRTSGTALTFGDGGGEPTPPTPPEPPTPPTPPGGPVDPSEAKMYITPATRTVTPNSEFALDIHTSTGTTTVNAVQAVLSYPADKLDFVRIDGTGSAFEIEAPSSGGSGKVTVARGNITPVSGDKLLAKVVFKAKSGTGAATLQLIEGTQILDAVNNQDVITALAEEVAGANITIQSSSTPPPQPPTPPTPPGTPPTPPPSPPGPGPKSGDLNGDGDINFEDLSRLLLKWGTTDTEADLNSDGKVNIYDLSILLTNYGS